MSYPLALQPLVIEDAEDMKEIYERIFEAITQEFGHLPFTAAPPCFAFSSEQAVRHLDSSKMFHVVILDLQLPQKPKRPAVDGIHLGLDLLNQCARRDRFPIPSLLVISAHLAATSQVSMQEELRRGFHYARPLVKCDYALLEKEVRDAYTEAMRYCAVGLHLRDAGAEQYPTITPREEDLLRRSVLEQQGTSGLDLEWWSAKRFGAAGSPAAVDSTWTKVLMGRYLLDGGRGASRPRFFKLLPGSHARPVIEGAQQLQYKLPHIKVTSTVVSASSALIVTEKVGTQMDRPRSLEGFFKQATVDQASDVARQVGEQVALLGDALPGSRPLTSLLWSFLDQAGLVKQWSRFGGNEILKRIGAKTDPLALYSELAQSDDKRRVNEQALVHGDLHISNVALDIASGRAEAYIFDAGSSARDVAGRDLAVLEVSSMLHQELPSETFIQMCSALYNSQDPAKGDGVDAIADPLGKVIVAFIQGLRKSAEAMNDADVYSLMVFDYALIQVGGLAFGSSGNKIREPRSALHLLSMVADWCQRLRAQSEKR